MPTSAIAASVPGACPVGRLMRVRNCREAPFRLTVNAPQVDISFSPQSSSEMLSRLAGDPLSEIGDKLEGACRSAVGKGQAGRYHGADGPSFQPARDRVRVLGESGFLACFKKYSQMKLQMKREALLKLNRHADEQANSFDTGRPN
jgi:hypothetical protein